MKGYTHSFHSVSRDYDRKTLSHNFFEISVKLLNKYFQVRSEIICVNFWDLHIILVRYAYYTAYAKGLI